MKNPSNDRFTFQVPSEYKQIIDRYKYPQETYVDFIKRCIVYMCSAMDVKKDKSLADLVNKTERVNLNDLAGAVKELSKRK